MPSIANQTEAELGGPWSVLARQRRDHIRLDFLLHALQQTAAPDQDAVLHRIARLVFPHAFAEESVLWPQIRRVLPDGEELTLRVEREHQEINELWTQLEDRSASAADREQYLDRLIGLLREDVRDEEDELLPRLQAALGVARLRLLGVSWELVRRTAPTRPHPAVSRRPPGNALAALPLTALDRTRDGLDEVERRTSGRLAQHVRSASQTLAHVAGRVEGSSAFRRGEDPTTRRR